MQHPGIRLFYFSFSKTYSTQLRNLYQQAIRTRHHFVFGKKHALFRKDSSIFRTSLLNYFTRLKFKPTIFPIFSKKQQFSFGVVISACCFTGKVCREYIHLPIVTKVYCEEYQNATIPKGLSAILESKQSEVGLQDYNILSIIKADIPLLLAVAVSVLTSAIINLYIPVVTGELVNIISDSMIIGNSQFTLSQLNTPALKLLGLFSLQGLMTFVHISLVFVLGENVASRLRNDLFSSILYQDIAFFDKTRSNDLVQRLSADISEFKHTFKLCVSQGLKSVAQVTGAIIQGFRISSQLTYTLIATMSMVYLVLNLYGTHLRRLSSKVKELDELASFTSDEAISNIRTVRSFVAEDKERQMYLDSTSNYAIKSKHLGFHIGAFQGLSNFTIGLLTLTILYSGGKSIITKQISSGDLMTYMIVTETATKSLANLGSLLGHIVKASATSNRIFVIINMKPSIPSRGGLVPLLPPCTIRFENVNFSYPTRKEHQVLENFNLDIPEGKVVALCGPSGSGKSTLGSLIERFYEVEKGFIFINGVDIKEVDPRWLRQHIGYIHQEPVLFNTSIKENIEYGRPGASEDEIKDAAIRANAHDFIESFPNGYETIVGERGTSLSGGQRQRIAIARALLKNPEILILDEATSALDAHSEKVVQEALEQLMRGRTTIVIAHRLSTIEGADKIVVMSSGVKGNILEQGHHSQLMGFKSHYYRLYHKLLSEKEN